MAAKLMNWLHNTGDRHTKPLLEPSRALGVALVIALLSLAVYLANGRVMGQGDNWPSRYVPASIVRQGSERVDDFPVLVELATLRVGERDGHHYSLLPKGPAYMAVPIYGIAELLGQGPTTAHDYDALAKLSAAIISSLCVLVMTLNLAHFLGGWRLVLPAVAYALGTSMWPVASQDLWTLTSAQLGGVLIIWCLLRSLKRPVWALVAWLPLVWSLESRPTYIVMVAVLAIYTLICYRRWAVIIAGIGLVGLAAEAALQLGFVGPFYRSLMQRGIQAIFTLDWGYLAFSFGRQLFDWSNGILTYSPFLVLFVLGVALLARDRVASAKRGEPPRYPLALGILAVAALGFVALYASYRSWRGGWSWTNRYALDGLPYAVMGLVPVLLTSRWHRALRWSLGGLVAISIGLNGLVAFYADQQWLMTVITDERRIAAIPLEESLLAYCWREATAQPTSIIFDHYGINRLATLASVETYAARGELIPRGETNVREERQHLGAGWSWTEQWGVWASLDSGFQIATIGPGVSTRNRAFLLVHVPDRQDQRLTVDAMAYCDLAGMSSYQQSMEVWYNHHRLGEVVFPRCEGDGLPPAVWSGIVPAEWITDGVDTISFRYARSYGGDLTSPSRKLAVAFRSVRLDPVETH